MAIDERLVQELLDKEAVRELAWPCSGRDVLLGYSVPDPSYANCPEPLFRPGKRT